MTIKIIEFVCTANHGRSPVAELIGINYIFNLGANGLYTAESSGSSVDKINRGEYSLGFMTSLVDGAIKRGDVYLPKDIKILTKGDKTAELIRPYFDKAIERFEAEEHLWRLEAVQSFGIEGKLKEHGEQTIARPNTIAVISMAERNNGQVQEIYKDSEYDPIIKTFEPQIHDAFGKTRDDYFKSIEQLTEQVKKEVDTLVN